MRSLPCFPLHVIKMEAFRHALIKKKKKVVLGLEMASHGKTTAHCPRLHPQAQKKEERKRGVM